MRPITGPTNPVYNEFAWEESMGLSDATPIPISDGARKIAKIIDENASWLQSEPRSSLSIVLRLFPGSVRRMKDALDLVVLVSDYLWDAGFIPSGTDTKNPTWHWLEGKRYV